jgi:hypothetical protein
LRCPTVEALRELVNARDALIKDRVAALDTFNVQRHLVSRNTLRAVRGEALQNWRAATAA